MSDLPVNDLGSLLSFRSRDYPSSVFIRFEGRNLTFADVERSASVCAGGLKGLGLKPGERVALLMENCPEYIITYFAIIKAGGIVVPLNTFLTAEEILFILKDSGSRVIVYGDSFDVHLEEIKKKLPGIVAVRYPEIPSGRSLSLSAGLDETAVFLYTSGTTGFPKAAMVSHRNLISNAMACKEAMGFKQSDRVILFLPLFHSFSFTVCVILPLYASARVVLLRSVRPFSNVIRSVLRERITFFVAVPTVYNILSRKKVSAAARILMRFLLKIRACVSGAAPLPENTLNEFEGKFGIPLIEGYGLTEAAPVVSVNPIDGVRKPLSVGLPLPGVEVRVVDDSGSEVPQGQVGELAVRGPNVMKGYHNRPEDNEKTLRDGWLMTGDLAKIDDDGYIYIVDRKKDLIIVDGMNVYPREVEEATLRLAGVEECAMVGIPDGRGSEHTCLYVRRREGVNLTADDIASFLRQRLARYKVPRKIRFIEEFPKTGTGKIKKGELRE
jgi:long-chain acyl-CoA synthetase